MDTITLVEDQIDDGLKLLSRLADNGFDVRVACWVKPADVDRWTLFVATHLVNDAGSAAPYRQLIAVLGSLRSGWLTSSDVTLVGENDPIAKDALDILKRFPHRKPIPSPRSWIGRIAAEEVYVYPPPGLTPVEIYHVIFPGTTETGILSLDRSSLEGRFWTKVGDKEYQGEADVHCVIAAPKDARLERNATTQLMELVWQDLHGKQVRSSANDVWGRAKFGLDGFRFLSEPPAARQINGTNSQQKA